MWLSQRELEIEPHPRKQFPGPILQAPENKPQTPTGMVYATNYRKKNRLQIRADALAARACAGSLIATMTGTLEALQGREAN